MPYIKPAARERMDDWNDPQDPGELNYALTKVLQNYLGEKLNYQLINDAIGALECCKLELYRRLVVPYEDTKIKENGDVYP